MKLYYATGTCSFSPPTVASETGIPLDPFAEVDLAPSSDRGDFVESVGVRAALRVAMRAEGLQVAA